MGMFRTVRRITLAMTVMYAGHYAVAQMSQQDAAASTTRASALHGQASRAWSLAGAQAAVVAHEIDGDTIAVYVLSPGSLPENASVTVRLIGIDTPETKKPNTPVECGGPAASAFTKSLLPVGAKVVLVPDEEKTDKYGRALRYVYTSTGLANLAIANAGYARDLLIEPNDAHHAQIQRAVDDAKAAGRGMWGTCADPFAPAS